MPRKEVAQLVCDRELARWLTQEAGMQADRGMFIRIIPSDHLRRMRSIGAVFSESYEWPVIPGVKV